MAKIEGGCLCGEVRYSTDVDPLVTVICHCRNCQKQSGGAYSLNIVLPKGSLDIQGDLSVYVDTGDSGKKLNRKFCGKCGSAVMSEPSAMDTVSVLKAGTLDDTSWVKPTMEIYCDSAQEWTKVQAELDSHARMMPG